MHEYTLGATKLFFNFQLFAIENIKNSVFHLQNELKSTWCYNIPSFHYHLLETHKKQKRWFLFELL